MDSIVPDLNDSNNVTGLISESEIASVIDAENEIHTEQDLPNVGGDHDAFLPILNEPVFTKDGGYSKARSIRIVKDGDQIEVGVVSSDYLLVSNQKLMDVSAEIMGGSGLIFQPVKKFFDGKRFRYLWRIEDAGLQVMVPKVGDVMGVLMQVTNSYDGSLKAGISFFMERLFCLNGQVSKEWGWGFDFRHFKQKKGDWEKNILNAGLMLNGRQIEHLPKRFAEACGKLIQPMGLEELAVIRNNENYLSKLPPQQFAQAMDKMLIDGKVTDPDNFTAYDLFNAGTNTLWNRDKMTQATFKNNALVVDGMLRYGNDTWEDADYTNPNQLEIATS